MNVRKRIPSRRTALSILGAVLLIAVVLPFALFNVPQVVGGDQSFVVGSSSMSPEIQVGDAVITEEVSPAAVEEGDVITFIDGERATIQAGQAGSNLVSHRVVDIEHTEQGPAFKTKGDANEEVDRGYVPASALVGRVMFTIPYIGYVILFAGTQLGLFTLVALPLGLLVLGELYDLARAARNEWAGTSTATDGTQDN